MQSLTAITTIRDWFLSPDSDYPKQPAQRCTAALRDLKRLSPMAFDQICEAAESTDQVRSGGWVTVYLGEKQLGDPHKGRASRAAIAMDVLLRVYESEMERAGFRG